MEHWKAIPGYEGLYEASDFGRIRTAEGKITSSARYSTRIWKQRILKEKCKKSGRADARVELWKGKEHKTWLVSRLIGLTWCKGYEEGLTINHIDGDWRNNRPENLEWITKAENIRKGFHDGLYDNVFKPVVLIDIKTGESLEFRSMRDCDRFLGKSLNYVSNALNSGRTEIMGYRIERTR